MKNLNLMFLPPNRIKLDRLELILHSFGEEITDYAKGYLYYVVTTTLEHGIVREAALYISIPEIQDSHRILSLTYLDIENVKVDFFPLKTDQTETNSVTLKSGDYELIQRIAQLLNGQIANATFMHLINVVQMKRARDIEE